MSVVNHSAMNSHIIITENSMNNDRQEQIVQQALRIIYLSMRQRSVFFSGAKDVRHYLALKLVRRQNEVFACLFLDSQHCLIEYKELFFGTINGASVYPRVVVQEAIRHNAAAVIVAHNHPSGDAEPSQSDKAITQKLGDVLNLIDVKLLDHWVIAEKSLVSFAERGLISSL